MEDMSWRINVVQLEQKVDKWFIPAVQQMEDMSWKINYVQLEQKVDKRFANMNTKIEANKHNASYIGFDTVRVSCGFEFLDTRCSLGRPSPLH